MTFDGSTAQIRDTLLRMALTYNTTLGCALLYAVLAYSSLHRYGLSKEAVHLKIAAIQHLSSSMDDALQTRITAWQHMATSMLLGAFEVSCQESYTRYGLN